jgi:hypothetical protein
MDYQVALKVTRVSIDAGKPDEMMLTLKDDRLLTTPPSTFVLRRNFAQEQNVPFSSELLGKELLLQFTGRVPVTVHPKLVDIMGTEDKITINDFEMVDSRLVIVMDRLNRLPRTDKSIFKEAYATMKIHRVFTGGTNPMYPDHQILIYLSDRDYMATSQIPLKFVFRVSLSLDT